MVGARGAAMLCAVRMPLGTRARDLLPPADFQLNLVQLTGCPVAGEGCVRGHRRHEFSSGYTGRCLA